MPVGVKCNYLPVLKREGGEGGHGLNLCFKCLSCCSSAKNLDLSLTMFLSNGNYAVKGWHFNEGLQGSL